MSNAKTDATTGFSTNFGFKETFAGVELELQATGVSGSGSIENRKSEGEHYVSGSGSLVFTGVTVVKPAGKGCKVTTDDHSGVPKEGAEGVVDTEPLRGTTLGRGDFVKFEPQEGSTLATFWITCTTKVPGLEGTWDVTGSFECRTYGATLTCGHVETTGLLSLKGKGSKAGVEGKLTFSAREGSASAFAPLSVTTVETPFEGR